MLRVTRNLRVSIALIFAVCISIGPLQALAVTAPASITQADSPQVIVTEVQMTAASASQEFVELYNTTDSDIDFAADNTSAPLWKLQFFSATSTAAGTPDWSKPTTSVTLTGAIAAHDYYVLAATGYAPAGQPADQTYSSRLSDSGGGLQLAAIVGSATTAHDRLMWKQAGPGGTLPALVLPTPGAYGSLQRLPNDDDTYTDENGLTGFVVTETATPGDMWMPPIPEVIEPEIPSSGAGTEELPGDDDADTTDPVDDDSTAAPAVIDNTGLTPPFLTELLPNPAAPDSDETAEYIELYNPNDVPFGLNGYSLQVGTSTLHSFTFGSAVAIPASSYVAFYVTTTHLTLTNTGGQARFIGSDAGVLSETTAYGAAAEGQAWALAAGIWQWTTQRTPGLENVIVAPVAAAKSTAAKAASAKATTKKAAAKTSAAKVKGTSTTKKKAASAKKAKTTIKTANTAAVSGNLDEPAKAPIHSGVLVAVALLAVLYGAYEYRHDISNRFHQLRGYRAVRTRAGR